VTKNLARVDLKLTFARFYALASVVQFNYDAIINRMKNIKRNLIWMGLAIVLASGLIAPEASAQTPTRETPPGRIIAQSGDAYIAYDGNSRTWEIGTEGIRRRMQYNANSGYRVISLKNGLTGREWLAPGIGTSHDLRLVIEGEIHTSASRDFQMEAYSTMQNPDKSLELRVSLRHETLLAHLHYVAYPGTNVIEQWVDLENTGKTILPNLDAIDSISLGLRPSADELTLYWVQGVSAPVADQNQMQPLPALRFRSALLKEGVEQIIGSNERSSEDSMGWFVLTAPALRGGMFGGIEWSGAWQMRAQRLAGQTIVRAGLDQIHLDLAPGETFSAPRRFLGFFRGDADEAAFASHAFARKYLLRPHPANFPWTQYNTWFAYYTDLNEDKLKLEVDNAAAMGLEAFVVDAGWYEGSPAVADFSYGLGTWRENREKFPSGLKTFSDYVHGKGMQFGLWVEPERVDLNYVGPGREVPLEWIAPNTNWVGDLPEGRARTSQICFGNRAAREWTKTWLTRVIRDYHVDWLKWDYNMWMSCDPPGKPGYQNYAHVNGLYEILDYLHAQFPNLVIENCASGGNRMDYALMRRTDVAWLSDATDPSYRVRYHHVGASFPFPPEYLNAAIVESWFEPLENANRDFGILRDWLRSRMMGAFAVSTPTLGWNPDFLGVVTQETARYKSIRNIIAKGRMYHLLPQSDLSIPFLEPPLEPDAIEFYDASSQRGVVFLFRSNANGAERRIVLRGLNANTVYQVHSADGTLNLSNTGRQLMSESIVLTFTLERPSALLFINPMPRP
jgi:alpha-galactosidase